MIAPAVLRLGVSARLVRAARVQGSVTSAKVTGVVEPH